MAHFLMTYDLAEDYLERRGAVRARHLAYAWAAVDRGELLLAGALADPVDGAVLLFEGEGPEVADAFARADPYVCEGLIARWTIRSWTTVVGEAAATPIRA